MMKIYGRRAGKRAGGHAVRQAGERGGVRVASVHGTNN